MATYNPEISPKKSSPKRTTTIKPVDDLYELRKEYLAHRLTPKQIETRLHNEWPDYLYQGKPIMEQHKITSELIAEMIRSYERTVNFYAEDHPDWSLDELCDAADKDFYGKVFGQSTNFLWFYDLLTDQFKSYPLSQHWLTKSRGKQRLNSALIELYALLD